MENFVVITSINAPTLAVKTFSSNEDISLVVVADKKTPRIWYEPGVKLLNLDQQKTLQYKIIKHLPFNHYSRKMIGYIYAIKAGAEVIIDSDDDNIPYKNYSFPPFEGLFHLTKHNLGFINIYRYFTDQNIWPRGLPLKFIKSAFDMTLGEREEKVGVWQGLANIDPDVDAIYRLTINEPCIFKESMPIVLENGTLCPMNSQNTVFRRELFPLLYLPTTVEFRFTDILRGFVAQPIMWVNGYKLGVTNANVIQKRNLHDHFEDFREEISMYLNIQKILDLILGAVSEKKTISANLITVYETLHKAKFVKKEELKTLENWLEDVYQ